MVCRSPAVHPRLRGRLVAIVVLAIAWACGDSGSVPPSAEGSSSGDGPVPPSDGEDATTLAGPADEGTSTSSPETTAVPGTDDDDTASSDGPACVPLEPGTDDCHPHEAGTARGAWFRKVASVPEAAAVGIHLVGVLPRIHIDHDRWFHTERAALGWQNGPLDRPSVYVGGRASEVEVDAGLTWDRVYHDDGRPTWTDRLASGSDEGDLERRFVIDDGGQVTSVTGTPRPEGLDGLVENFSFRPFWRAEGTWANPPVGDPTNVYFHPGSPIRMQLEAIAPETLELAIVEDDGDGSFSVEFDVSGWGIGAPQQWKRVSSIDQFTVIDGVRIGLESAGLDVLPTHTLALDASWSSVRLLATGSDTLAHLDCTTPAVIGADAVVVADYGRYFRVREQTRDGGELLSIVPIEPDCAP